MNPVPRPSHSPGRFLVRRPPILHILGLLISLVLTEQNPYAGAGPIVGKVLIVCPVTLINVRPFYTILRLCLNLSFVELEERISQMVECLFLWKIGSL